MGTPPGEGGLRDALREQYGLDVAQITRLRLGRDIAAAVFRVEAAGGAAFFLKVRAGRPSAASLLAPGHLRDHGVAEAVAPLPTAGGGLWSPCGRHALVLYPYVADVTAMAMGLQPHQWIALGDILRRVHAAPVSAELERAIPREAYLPDGAETVRRLHAHVAEAAPADRAGQELGAIWRARRPQIDALLAQAEDLGRQLAGRMAPCVVCHADFHTHNVLVDGGGRLWVVDWDDATLAPPERDLMFMLGGGLNRTRTAPGEERLFLRGYGTVGADEAALAYYRHARAVSDIAYTAAQVALRPDLGPARRQAALADLRRLFLPGRIVDIALGGT